MRLISEDDVERLLDPALAIASAADAFRQAGRSTTAPGRLDLPRQEPTGNVLVLAGHGEGGLFCTKNNMHVYPDAGSRERKAASMLLLWDAIRCQPLALLATTGFNNHRTAAGLAAATDKLAAPGAKTLTVFGAGKIAPATIRYLQTVRPFERIMILGRDTVRAAALAAALAREAAFARTEISAESDVARATREADVIVTITTAAEPVFAGADVKPGALVVLAGANRPHAREADDALIRRSTIYTDHRDGCLTRAGDLVIPLASGVLRPEQIVADIGDVFGGTATKPASADVTVFKSMGIIGQDIALAHALYQRAQERGIGLDFDAVTGAASVLAAQKEAS